MKITSCPVIPENMESGIMTDLPLPEFSRSIPAGSVSREEKIFTIEANAEERHNLARRFNLLSLDSMKAEIRLVSKKKKGNDVICLFGELEADIVQSCVVSMKPVRSHVKAVFERVFATTEEDAEEADEGGNAEIKIDANTIDPPDKLINGDVEIGECTAEQLALELPPFPRTQGIIFDGVSSGPDGQDDQPDNGGPFSKLAKIREKLK